MMKTPVYLSRPAVTSALGNGLRTHIDALLMPSETSPLTFSDQWVKGKTFAFGAVNETLRPLPDNLSAANRAIYDAVGDIQGYHLFHLGGSYQVSKNVSLNANIYNLFNKGFRKFTQVNVNGTPTWVNQYFQGGQSVSGTTLPGRTLWLTANVQF